MLNKLVFLFAHQALCPNFYSTYKTLIKNQWKKYSELKIDQENTLRKLIKFCYTDIPYYHNCFKKLGLKPEDIKSVEDLEKLPILDKDTIKNNFESFKPLTLSKISHYNRATSGSTGQPLKFRVSKFDRFLSVALLYRGWSYAGYELGDKVFFLGGSSLGIGASSKIKKKLNELTRNILLLSSFDLDEQHMNKYVSLINTCKPRYGYCYPYSLYFLAKWIEEHRIKVSDIEAVFTTAEKLIPQIRKKIEDVFETKVYDCYGLNDGSISAFECPEHNGLHIDMERGLMEIVDESGNQVNDGRGKILATSLYNYAMPFIRYDTGDIGYLSEKTCNCGRGYRLLEEVIGRQQDFLVTPEGKNIHGLFFTYIFWKINGVKEFQVIQDSLGKIRINILPEENFELKYIAKIKDLIKLRSAKWEVEIKLVDCIKRTKAGKYKIVINNIRD